MITPESDGVPGFISLQEITQVAAAIQKIVFVRRRGASAPTQTARAYRPKDRLAEGPPFCPFVQ